MKFNAIAMAVAIGLLVAGCGGGGGGSSGASGGSNGGGSGGGGSGGTGQVEPVTDGPISTAPVVSGVATFAGARGFYRISRVGSDFQVASTRVSNVSLVSGAQFIRFQDIKVNLGIGDKAVAIGPATLKSLIEVYIAFFRRMPDADSVSAAIDQLEGGQALTQIADKFYGQAVLEPALTGFNMGMLNSEFVIAVYKEVFGMTGATAPAAADIESWTSRIDKGGITRGALVVLMLSAAREGYPGLSAADTLALLDNRADVGDYVAVQQGISYNTADESVSRRTAIAAAVTSTDKTVALSMLGFSDTLNLKVAGK
jgi:hydrogenase maturation factor